MMRKIGLDVDYSKCMQLWTMEPKKTVAWTAQAGSSAWVEVAIDIKNALKKCWLPEMWDNAFQSGALSQWACH